ncbi:MAG TPA: 50S ribosomal protein L15 [Gemmataceae bacterium]
MDLSQVHQGVVRRKRKKRVGRGIGSGHGKTATRGHKGQYASAGAEMFGPLFEGGQTPLYRRVPKRGFSNARFAKRYLAVNVGDIDAAFAEGETVTPEALRARGLAKKAADGIRVLGGGEVTKRLTVRAHHFSASAREKLAASGGTAEVIPPPKKPVKNKMKPRPPKQSG